MYERISNENILCTRDRYDDVFLVAVPFIQPSGGVAYMMTLRLSEFRVSVERPCRSTRANCTCELRERHRIIITQIIIAHSNGGS